MPRACPSRGKIGAGNTPAQGSFEAAAVAALARNSAVAEPFGEATRSIHAPSAAKTGCVIVGAALGRIHQVALGEDRFLLDKGFETIMLSESPLHAFDKIAQALPAAAMAWTDVVGSESQAGPDGDQGWNPLHVPLQVAAMRSWPQAPTHAAACEAMGASLAQPWPDAPTIS